jgi:hypothetical protein
MGTTRADAIEAIRLLPWRGWSSARWYHGRIVLEEALNRPPGYYCEPGKHRFIAGLGNHARCAICWKATRFKRKRPSGK